jgi:phage FluMu protein Com
MAEVVTCGHCNTVKLAGAEGWKYELGFDFCPDCKNIYWHSQEEHLPAEESTWECLKCGASVLYTGEPAAPLTHC